MLDFTEKHNKDAYKILKEKFPNLNIDDGSQNIMLNLKNSKLCIISNNSTTFLQTLRLNIPTIVFWDETIVESRKSSTSHLNSLLIKAFFIKILKVRLYFAIIIKIFISGGTILIEKKQSVSF